MTKQYFKENFLEQNEVKSFRTIIKGSIKLARNK